MAPFVKNLPTYVKDTNHALRIFDSFNFDESDARPRFLFTMDIKSLYTVIPNNGGLEALTYYLDQRTIKEPPTHTLTRLAELVLTLNAFLTGRRHDGDRRFIKWTRFLVKASWLNIRRKCCKACGTGTQERYCLVQDACAC